MAESQTVNISHSVINSTIINVNQTGGGKAATSSSDNGMCSCKYIKMPEYTTNTLIIFLCEF